VVATPVEFALVVFYGPSAHRATYGRLDGRDTRYTKDYIQLSRRDDFLRAVSSLFPASSGGTGSVQLTYHWPAGTTPGAFVFRSADRPHLKWETSLGAPKAWKMTPEPDEATAETIPGNPSHLDFAAAENELALLASRGAGQPYLLAIKLRDEPNKLHLRTYLAGSSAAFAWADIAQHAPREIQGLVAQTNQASALAWSAFQSGGAPPVVIVSQALSELDASPTPTALISTLGAEAGLALANYLRNPGYGLFFDPTRNHDAWLEAKPLSNRVAESLGDILAELDRCFPPSAIGTSIGDALAEELESNPVEVIAFREQIRQRNFEVPDSTANVKTRGSAQKAFASEVKANYRNRCAITGISSSSFLVASHIVPWSEDQSIRLDPSNGICLSLIVDRAFEKGHLVIDDDLSICINWAKVGNDDELRKQLESFEGLTLALPVEGRPNVEYLRRRRCLVDHCE
jgi:hypothetical protein